MSNIYSERYQALLAKLIEIRKKTGLTQGDVAKRLKKPQSFISKIESGERKIGFTEIEDLSKIYEVSLASFETSEIIKNEN